MKTLKKLDIIIIVFLMLLSFTPNIFFYKSLSKHYNSSYANIEISGEFYDSIPISSFKGEKKITIETKYGNKIILIKNNAIQIIESDCKDEICVKQGQASKVGESIICLPHQLIIEIKGNEEDSSSDMILSH